jgi:hypothetical protein
MTDRDPRFAWDDYTDLRSVPFELEPPPESRHTGPDAGAHHRPRPPESPDSAGDPDVHGNPFEVARRLANAALDPEDGDEISRAVRARSRSRARTRARLAADDAPGDLGTDDAGRDRYEQARAEARARLTAGRPENVAARQRDRYTTALNAERAAQAEETRKVLAGLGIAGVGHEPEWL